jgi:hypothetical protein
VVAAEELFDDAADHRIRDAVIASALSMRGSKGNASLWTQA